MKFAIYFAAFISVLVLGWQVSCDDNQNEWKWGGGGADFERWVSTVTTWKDFGNGILDHLPEGMSLSKLMETFNGITRESVNAIIAEGKLIALLRKKHSSIPITPEKKLEGKDADIKKFLAEETSADTLEAQNEIPSWSNHMEKKEPKTSKKGQVNPKAPRTITSQGKKFIDSVKLRYIQ